MLDKVEQVYLTECKMHWLTLVRYQMVFYYGVYFYCILSCSQGVYQTCRTTR